MPDDQTMLLTFLRLAAVAGRRQRPYQQDKFLVLAGAAAAVLDRWELAEACRKHILHNNPGHMLKRFASMHDALTDEEFHPYLRRLERDWPYEKAEHVLSHPDVAGTEAAQFDEVSLVALLGLEE